MSDMLSKQPVRLIDVSENEYGTAIGYGLFVQLTDGTEVANVNASNQLEVEVKNTSVTVTASDLDIRDIDKAQDDILVYCNTVKDGSGTSYVPLVDADGHLQVDILSGVAVYQYQDGVSNAGAYGNLVLGDDGTNLQFLSVDTNGRLRINVIDALPAGDNNIGNVDLASPIPAGTNNIGDVDIASIAAGDNNIGNVDIASIAAGDNNIGNVDIASELPAGSNNIGDVDIASIAAGSNTIGKVYITDGTEDALIDASGNLQVNIGAVGATALPVSKDGSANSESNPIFVQVVTGAVSGTEIHSYDQAVAIVKNGTDNHDYTVTATKTFKLRKVSCAASGSGRYEVQTGALAALATQAVKFGSSANPNVEFVFDPPIEIPDTSTGTIRVIRKNTDNSTQDLYSTIMGDEV